jgi:hypothetical protein
VDRKLKQLKSSVKDLRTIFETDISVKVIAESKNVAGSAKPARTCGRKWQRATMTCLEYKMDPEWWGS